MGKGGEHERRVHVAGEMGAGCGDELGERGRAAARGRLIGRDGHSPDAVPPMDRPERVIAMIAAQIGTARMPSWRGMSGVDLGHDERHREVHAERRGIVDDDCPRRTAMGAHSRAVPLPAENSARSMPARPSSLSASMPIS